MVKELIQLKKKKEYVRECIQYLNSHGHIIDYDPYSLFYDATEMEDRIIELYNEVVESENREIVNITEKEYIMIQELLEEMGNDTIMCNKALFHNGTCCKYKPKVVIFRRLEIQDIIEVKQFDDMDECEIFILKFNLKKCGYSDISIEKFKDINLIELKDQNKIDMIKDIENATTEWTIVPPVELMKRSL